MDQAELKETVIAALTAVAPDIEAGEVEMATDLRNDLDIDSVDYLNFIIKLNETLGVEIPEAEYRNLSTPGKAVEYLRKILVR